MPNNIDPSLDDLTIFLAVCWAGGFRSAARQLGLSPAHVSETVTRLEAQLGVALLARTTRSVMPTEAGRELAGRLGPLLGEARAALQDVSGAQGEVRGLLKLNVGAGMMDMLSPLIDRFISLHPGARVELVVDDRLVDITAAGCDAGIRYGKNLAQDMIAVPIGPRLQHLALAAAPAYLKRRGTPEHPRDVMGHDCVRVRFSSGVLSAWRFERGAEALSFDPPGKLVVGIHAMRAAIDFACAGHGLVWTFQHWLDAYLNSGELLPVLRDWWQPFEGPWMYFPNRRVPAPLRALIDLVASERDQAAPAA